MNKCTVRGQTLCIWVHKSLSYFDSIYSVCMACSDQYPLPISRDPQLFQLGGRGHRVGGKGIGLPGGRVHWYRRAIHIDTGIGLHDLYSVYKLL